MPVELRPIRSADIDACGRIIFDAFFTLAQRHDFPPDFPTPEAAIGLCRDFAAHPACFGVVAEADGQVVGSNFLQQRDPVAAVGPITIDPTHQRRGTGRKLMEAVIDRARATSKSGPIRLVQDAFNTASMSLYASLGFEAKEPLALVQGTPEDSSKQQDIVRPLTEDDLEQCGELCEQVHGVRRTAELQDAIKAFRPVVLERGGRIRGYCSAPNFWPLNHGVAETVGDMQQLLLGAAALTGEPIALLVPIRSADLFRWCLRQHLRVVKPMTLMTMGFYREPEGAFYPSVLY